MTALRSPSSSTNGPPPKKGVFSSSSSRRPSTSSVSSGGMQLPQGIGYSPGSSTTYYTTPSSPAGPGSGIPALRTLRSLLPFGPGSSHSKSSNAAQTSSPSSTSASPNTSVVSRSPFSGFGSVRKSMAKDRERKSSLSNDALSSPVIAIDKQGDDSGIRRSASLSNIEKPLPREPDFGGFSNTPFRQESGGSFSSRDTRTLGSGFTLRTPSPGPPLSVELSTIIEADSSGVSKHFADLPVPPHTPSLPHSRSSSPHPPSRRPSPSPRDYLHPFRKTSGGSIAPTYQQQQQPNADSAELDPDTSDLLHVSPSEVANQVRDALRKSTSSSKSGEPSWRDVGKAVVIIDADEHPEVAEAVDNIANTTFNVDTVDPDLLALLSPNAQSEKTQLPTVITQLTGRRQSTGPQPSSASPTTPTFSGTSRLPKARHSSSFLPRTSSPVCPIHIHDLRLHLLQHRNSLHLLRPLRPQSLHPPLLHPQKKERPQSLPSMALTIVACSHHLPPPGLATFYSHFHTCSTQADIHTISFNRNKDRCRQVVQPSFSFCVSLCIRIAR
ncbi:hypothetical protein CPB84DRAFT_180434 [Gymnopilus junonius]|uniref:Uncharacterized protein n=1 Tax=Gymnopilus junonius TaxID=109634 RepID=A0A9P5NFQ6_GYMJU|nr:hypothetical protein CPB84DRAFT_180434 [Gymnopilus junonius]